MLSLGLTEADRKVLIRTLLNSHTRLTRISVLDLNHNPLMDVSDRLITGEVTVDVDADVTRICTLTLLDAEHALDLDTEDPDDASLYLDRMIQVSFDVRVEALGRIISIPLFTGPITHCDRESEVVEIEAHGKEQLAMGSLWNGFDLRDGSANTDGITRVMKAVGETSGRMSIPNLPNRLSKKKTLDRMAVPWEIATGLAAPLPQRWLFYDALGVLQLRDISSTHPVWTFRTYDDPANGNYCDVLTRPSLSFDINDVRNAILVTGKGNNKGTAVADSTHPLAPGKLGRKRDDGTIAPRYIGETVDANDLNSDARCVAKAKSVLAARLLEVVQFRFDAIPMPLLEPNDLVRIDTGDYQADFRLKQFSIGLTSEGGPMTVGSTRKTKINRVQIRGA